MSNPSKQPAQASKAKAVHTPAPETKAAPAAPKPVREYQMPSGSVATDY